MANPFKFVSSFPPLLGLLAASFAASYARPSSLCNYFPLLNFLAVDES
jgi:hypothetical protein